MLLSRFLSFSTFWAVVVHAQESSSSNSQTVLTGGSAAESTPTGSYISYSSTVTLSASSAITTEAILSTITNGETPRTTTLGSTTIFGINGATMTSNTSEASYSTSVYLLSGGGRATTTLSLNGTSNATATSRTSTSIQPTNTQACNNYVEFCSRTYDNITEVAAHNSPFVKAGNAAANQALNVRTQLDDGIRLLQGQMHFNGSVPHFCHTSCDVLDAGPITDYLTQVYDWVSTHPFDVVTLLLGNGAYNSVTEYVPFIESTGLVQYAYVPPKIPMARDDWPTLASMILTGKRVVIFMDYNANQTTTPWILDEFSQMWETPFDPTDRTFPCTVQRPPDLSPEAVRSRLYTMNHNLNYEVSLLGISLLVPSIPLLNVTNNVSGDGSLGRSTQQCDTEWGYPPKFLNVDYYNVGNGSVFDVAAKWNNVTYNRPCCGSVESASNRALPALSLLAGVIAGSVGFVNLL